MVPYDASNLIDCPLDEAGIRESIHHGAQSALFHGRLSGADLVLVSPMLRTRATIFYELLAAGLLNGTAARPTVRMHTGLVEVGTDPGNIGTRTTDWSENFTRLGWDRPEAWDGGGESIERWNSKYALLAAPVPSAIELEAWRSATREVVASRDISPQSLASLPSLRSSICDWACSRGPSRVVLVSHHIFMSELLCLDPEQASDVGRPFRVEDVPGFLSHLQGSFGQEMRPPSGLQCSRTFRR
mmetsp:Transcript_10076/g.27399  ORF Transcript_10076/g.27399 Transcript_10076/m.27399 type:complete len:243 (+) Transcript_10076:3-731(+)